MQTFLFTNLETAVRGHRTPVCHEYRLTIMYHRTIENTSYFVWSTHCCSHGKRTNLVGQWHSLLQTRVPLCGHPPDELRVERSQQTIVCRDVALHLMGITVLGKHVS